MYARHGSVGSDENDGDAPLIYKMIDDFVPLPIFIFKRSSVEAVCVTLVK